MTLLILFSGSRQATTVTPPTPPSPGTGNVVAFYVPFLVEIPVENSFYTDVTSPGRYTDVTGAIIVKG